MPKPSYPPPMIYLPPPSLQPKATRWEQPPRKRVRPVPPNSSSRNDYGGMDHNRYPEQQQLARIPRAVRIASYLYRARDSF